MPTIGEELKHASFQSEQIKANINLLFTANWLYRAITAKLKPYGVTHEQFNVLRILKGSHPSTMCQKDILSRMISPNSNITLIVKKLVDKGLIKVEQSEKDRREYQIGITPKGVQLLRKIDAVLGPENELLIKLSTSEAFHLNALLEKLRS